MHNSWHYTFYAKKTRPRFHAGLQTAKRHFWQNTVEEKFNTYYDGLVGNPPWSYADVWLKIGGTVYGIDSANGGVYLAPQWETSFDVVKNISGDWVYGGKYDPSYQLGNSGYDVPTQIKLNLATKVADAVWVYDGTNHLLTITLTNLPSAFGTANNWNAFQFIWGTGICANDPITNVPIPGAVWLFGSGLLALLGLRRGLVG